MLRNFKHLELTRHHLYTKTKRVITDIAGKEENSFLKLAEVVFSSALSLFLTYLAERYFVNKETLNIRDTILLFVGAIIVYCVLYVIIKWIYSKISCSLRNYKYNKKLHSPDFSLEKCKTLVDDFDHIAFDNIIIAYELVDEIKNSSDIQLRTFFYHEIIYYLKIAIKKTKEITHENRREQCLNIFGNSNGVDVFRLFNIQRNMQCLCQELKDILSDNDNTKTIELYSNGLKENMAFQLQEIEDDISTLEEICKNAANDLKHKN